MKKILNNPVLNLAVRIIIGGVFIYAAIGKIADPAYFAKEIANYRLFPEFSYNLIALALPWIELVIAIFIIAGVRLKANALLASVLMAAFILLVLSAMLRGLNINCGCFSHKIEYVGWKKILENSGLLLLSLYVYFFPSRKLVLERANITS